MSSLSSSASRVRTPLPYPPYSVAFADHKPLDQWLADLSAFFLGLGSDRGLLVAEHIQELAREVRCCTTPGRQIDVETFLDRRAVVRQEFESDPWPPVGSWVDVERWGIDC